MTTYRIRVSQEYLALRTAVISVEADSLDEAIEQVASGSIDTPDFDDESWQTGWTLRSERCEHAGVENLDEAAPDPTAN